MDRPPFRSSDVILAWIAAASSGGTGSSSIGADASLQSSGESTYVAPPSILNGDGITAISSPAHPSRCWLPRLREAPWRQRPGRLLPFGPDAHPASTGPLAGSHRLPD